VHSLKDLPTELPSGLKLGAVGKRADVRDVLIYRAVDSKRPEHRGFEPGIGLQDLPTGAQVATSSPRRKAQLLVQNPTLKLPDIRGNVPTRLQKLSDSSELDATVLAMAGLVRLGLTINAEGRLQGEGIREGLFVTILKPEMMLPCVGQGALGIEVRDDDESMSAICKSLNHPETEQCVTAERAFLAAMGGGCQSPVAAYAQALDGQLHMRAVSFADGPPRRAEAARRIEEAIQLGQFLAGELRPQ
jgi:hydroxymethylbilane synthase